MSDHSTPPAVASDLRRKAGAQAREDVLKTAGSFGTLSLEQQLRVIHELQVHGLELEQQNEELRGVQTRRDEARDRYLDLYDRATVGYVAIGEEGVILEANLTAEEMLGVARGVLVGQPMSDLVMPADWDTCSGKVERLFVDGLTEECEVRLRRRDGSHFWARINIRAGEGSGGARIGRAVVTDIDERRRAEEALQSSWQMIEGIVNSIPARIFWKDRDLVYLGCNLAFARDAGFAGPEEIIGKDDFQLAWREDAEAYRSDDRQVIESGRPKLLIEESQTTPEGKVIELLTSKSPLRDSEGGITGVLGTYVDVTERRHTENALKLFRELVDHVSDTVEVIDPETFSFIDGNTQAWSSLGYTREEFLTLKVWDIDPNPIVSAGMDWAESGAKSGSVVHESVHRRKDGSVFPVEVNVEFVQLDRPYVVSVARDISDRRQAAEALRESELRYRTFIDSSSDLVFLKDESFRYVISNERNNAFLGRSEAEVLGHTDFDLMSGEAAEGCRASDQEALELGVSVTREEALDPRSYQTVKFPVPLAGGGVGVGGFVRDITEHKQVESALRKSEALYRLVVESAHEGVVVVQDGRLIFANQVITEIMGYAAEELREIPFADLIHPDDRAKAVGRHLQRLAGEVPSPDHHAFRVVTRSGDAKWIEASAVVIAWKGRPATLNFLTDLSDRKRAEDILKESESRFRAVLETIPLLAVLLDTEGTITLCNEAALQRTGWTREEVVGRSIFEIFVPVEARRELMDEVFLPAVTSGESPPALVTEILTRSGERRLVGLSTTVIKGLDGEVVGVATIGEDITERTSREETMADQLAELQRWQDVMLGREDRIQELKREVNDLMSRAGEAPAYPSEDASPVVSRVEEAGP